MATPNPQRGVSFAAPRSSVVRSDSVSSRPIDFNMKMVNTNDELPEQWSLVNEWYIDKRKSNPYDLWKYDVQSQISNIAKRIEYLQDEHELETNDGKNFKRSFADLEREMRISQAVQNQVSVVPNSLGYGLARK